MRLRLVSDNVDLHQLTEEHQERALRAIKYSPRQLLSDAEKWAKRERELFPSLPQVDLYDLVPEIFHERHYADRAYYDAHEADALLTKYDKKDFLDRFYNINVLCHRYFEEVGFPARDIKFSSLPLSHINGFCASVPEDQTLILLNEGIFYMLPHLIHEFPDKAFADCPDDLTLEELNEAPEYDRFRNVAAEFFISLSHMMSDELSPSRLLFDPEIRGPVVAALRHGKYRRTSGHR